VELQAGQRIDRYVLIEPLGEGGQGAVWKASDPLTPEVPCALKLVPVVLGRPNDLERTRREARALAQLEHPSLVRSSGLFEDLKLGVLGIAMELVEGTSLKQLCREGRLGPRERGLVLEHIAHALRYLHESGIVHRDVKLDNVLVRESFWADPASPDGVKLVDLGIAAVAGSDRDLTLEGTVVGTLPYLAPELLDPATFEGEQSSPRVDVFAFGVMGWLLLSGQHPSGLPGTSSAVDYTRAYRAKAAPQAEFPVGTLDSRWQGVLTRCLSLVPSERLADATAILAALEQRAPDSVVVRPSRSTAATPQAMFDATALAEPAARADAATIAIGKPKGKKSSLAAPVLILMAAGAAGAIFALRGATAPDTPPVSSTPRVASARAPSAPRSRDAGTDAAPEAQAAEAAPTEAAVEAAAATDPCAAGCRSGRGCGPEGCAAGLDPEAVYALRLGRVDGDEAGSTPYATYATAEVCVSITGRSKPPKCMPLAETSDGGVTKSFLSVSFAELVNDGLDITLENVLPQGRAPLAKKLAVKLENRREHLCNGLIVEGLEAQEDVHVARVVLYLDEPGVQPTRCP